MIESLRRIVRWFTVLPVLILAACTGSTAQSIAVGTVAPAFTLPAATGEQVSLADYAGRPVLLYFHMAGG
jgi:cytochrome oxidase Cu insertion factor (SCO1/SenC/PrrC family)